MMGTRMLFQIEKRCREIFPNVDDLFGGLNVYLFGDFRQLPPVKDTVLYADKLYDTMSTEGLMVFKTFQVFLELKHAHRQSLDTSGFSDLVELLAIGQFTKKDWALLCTRREAVLSEGEKQYFEDALHLYPTNLQVMNRNEEFLRQTKRPVFRITAENTPNIPTSISEDLSQTCPKTELRLQAMLRTNLWVDGGLVNGSLGTVQAIVFREGSGPPEHPLYILAEFDSFKGPFVYERTFPIVCITRSWTGRGIKCNRRQFPLSVAHAIRIHKAQGLTLSKVVIDIGTRESSPGLTYVALSRARKLEDIMFTCMYPKSRFDDIGKGKNHQLRVGFMQKFVNSAAG